MSSAGVSPSRLEKMCVDLLQNTLCLPTNPEQLQVLCAAILREMSPFDDLALSCDHTQNTRQLSLAASVLLAQVTQVPPLRVGGGGGTCFLWSWDHRNTANWFVPQCIQCCRDPLCPEPIPLDDLMTVPCAQPPMHTLQVSVDSSAGLQGRACQCDVLSICKSSCSMLSRDRTQLLMLPRYSCPQLSVLL